MATQIVMDRTGDTRHQFDPSDAAGVAAERTGPGKSKVVAKFDPAAEETLFIPGLKSR